MDIKTLIRPWLPMIVAAARQKEAQNPDDRFFTITCDGVPLKMSELVEYIDRDGLDSIERVEITLIPKE